MNSKTDEYVKLIAESLTFLYGDDMTCPGIILSRLKNGNYYVSLSRYDSAFGKGRRIIYKSQAADMEEVLKNAAEYIVKQKVDNPISALSELIHS